MKMLGCGFGIVHAGRARWIGSLVNGVRIESCKASTQSLASHEAGMFTGTGEGGGRGGWRRCLQQSDRGEASSLNLMGDGSTCDIGFLSRPLIV